VPTESCIFRGHRTGPPLIALLVALGVNYSSPARAQDEASESANPAGTVAGEIPSTVPTAALEPSAGATAGPTLPTPAPTSSARSMIEAVRAAATRQLVPFDPSQDPRLRSLDTSFPAEQPEVVEAQVAPETPNYGPRAPSRRTMLRTVDGVTVLTNVDEPPEENVTAPKAVRFASSGSVSPGATVGAAYELRQVSANVNALEPNTRRRQTDAFPLWLWALAGLAVVLLVPIAVLLTRPARKQ
jgi:hypothetical protein